MHELSVAAAVLKAVAAEARAHGAARVLSVRLRVGALTDLDPEVLSFGWEAVTAAMPLVAGCTLYVERVPVAVACGRCGTRGPAAPPGVLCAACGGHDVQLVAGEELDIAEVELDAPEDRDAEEGAVREFPAG